MTDSKIAAPHIGMIGLGVMGSRLAQNIERNGFPCAVYNLETDILNSFIAEHAGKKFAGAATLEELVKATARPRQLFMMIKAGAPVDFVLQKLIPLLEKGDIVIDGGNSHFKDTQRREALLATHGLNFMGIGISGGEEGALNGASLMPGGPKDAWQHTESFLTAIAARFNGEPCAAYVGPDGAGHFVKTVHNGIEYGDMQIIAESYDLMKRLLGYAPEKLSETFERWNQGPLSSYLIEITAKIFAKNDDQGEGFLVDKILDKAGQKGTGSWTAQTALDLGIAVPTLVAAVEARCLSALKTERKRAVVELKALLPKPTATVLTPELIHDALYAAKILTYAQGLALIKGASEAYSWNVDLAKITSLWRAGCIIRARFLETIRSAYATQPELVNLVFSPAVYEQLAKVLPALRTVVGEAARCGIALPAFNSALSYVDSYVTETLPQNLTQAQRDYFGAHTYERTDKDGIFHTKW